MSDTLVVNEIYLSVQGESTFAGLPCVFVRLTACNLRCSYCDTAYAFTEGKKLSLGEIRARIEELAGPFAASRPPDAASAKDATPQGTILQPVPELPAPIGTNLSPLLEGKG